MTEKQALLCAINTIDDMANEFLETYEDETDPYYIELKEAQKKLQEMYQAR